MVFPDSQFEKGDDTAHCILLYGIVSDRNASYHKYYDYVYVIEPYRFVPNVTIPSPTDGGGDGDGVPGSWWSRRSGRGVCCSHATRSC